MFSPRAGGLSIGINLNPDKACNFNCVYCDVDRTRPAQGSHLDADVVVSELIETFGELKINLLQQDPAFSRMPGDLLLPRQIALSGEGEPTLAPQFREIVEAIVHVRAVGRIPFLPVVLITNGSKLHDLNVDAAIQLLTRHDQVWIKLDGGTDDYLEELNKPCITVDQLLANILFLSRRREVVIQSMFPSIQGTGPSRAQVVAYAERLAELKDAGAKIKLVQIYSAHRVPQNSGIGHLPLASLSAIAETVREVSGLKAEVF
jgi:wyosine [tRNA(Phe)-imidazoG37] synthetase (radical SAM superfamily)